MDFDPSEPAVADLDGDGIFDSVQFDTDHDGRIDTESTKTPDGRRRIRTFPIAMVAL